jgi:signal transduction histidine kinase/CheY-like chemotaxis protein
LYVDGQGVDFTPLRVGARVHLVGLTAPGDFAPMIVNPSFTVGGVRALPAPIASKEEIFVGSLDSSRVRLEGVIKAAHIAREHTVFDLQHGTHSFEANLPIEVKNADQLLDARVRVTGVAGTHFNSRRQFLGVFVFVPDMAGIDILRRGPDPDTMPTRSVSALMQFAPGMDMDDPVKVSGVVTYSNDSTVYVQDASGGVAITARDHPPLSPGDVVEAIGYARPASFTAAIENGHIKKIGRAAQPQPVNITATEALDGNYDSQLIRIQGILIDRSLDASKQTFVLSAGRIIFRVYTDQLSALPGLKKGSVVSVTGVCSVEVQSTYGSILPKSFSVLLRSPGDVTVVRKPSWWSLEHTIELAATLASFALVAIFWIGALRRQVLLKTRALAHRSDELMKAKNAAESASRLKSEFLANMSHEIRTPMNGVLGMTSLALGSEISSEVREYLTMANDSAKSLLTLLNDVLDLSKIEASRLTIEHIAFSVRQVVTCAVRTLAVNAHDKGIELIIDVDAAVPDVLTGDPYRLHQVLLNLTGNAIKFTGRGEVVISVSVKQAEEQSVSVLFVVRDSGIGIAPEQQDSIFHSFTQGDGSTTRKFGGTGLGLSICRELVHLMNGEIGVDSIPGTGSSFWFTSTFTLADAQPEVLQRANSEVLRGKRVLIVDDNQTNRALLNKATQLWGMTPSVVENANAALIASQEAARGGEPFYLYLVDVHMPGRDGFELVMDLNQAGLASDSTILMLSSVDLRNTAQRSKELGIDRYLLKPATADELLEAVLLSVGSATPPANTLSPRGPLPRRDAQPAILLAEDNLVNQTLTRIILEKAGYRVKTVTNGTDALEEVKNTVYDLVLMDVQMPDMDGYESVHKIRQSEANAGRHPVPIIALTAHAMDGHRERCLSVGMDAYISKPLNKEQLLAKISELVGHVQADSSETLVSS